METAISTIPLTFSPQFNYPCTYLAHIILPAFQYAKFSSLHVELKNFLSFQLHFAKQLLQISKLYLSSHYAPPLSIPLP